jgi:hypothetical protein
MVVIKTTGYANRIMRALPCASPHRKGLPSSLAGLANHLCVPPSQDEPNVSRTQAGLAALVRLKLAAAKQPTQPGKSLGRITSTPLTTIITIDDQEPPGLVWRRRFDLLAGRGPQRLQTDRDKTRSCQAHQFRGKSSRRFRSGMGHSKRCRVDFSVSAESIVAPTAYSEQTVNFDARQALMTRTAA